MDAVDITFDRFVEMTIERVDESKLTCKHKTTPFLNDTTIPVLRIGEHGYCMLCIEELFAEWFHHEFRRRVLGPIMENLNEKSA